MNNSELVNRIGEFLDSTMIDVQNEVCMINEVKQASEIDIDTLKLMHKTLTKILKKWRDIVLETINIDNSCSKTKDTKKKDSKLDTKKEDSKPDTTKKDSKSDTKKKEVNQILRRKIVNQILRRKIVSQILRRKIINQILSRKIINQIHQKKKIENRASNRIKYEIQDFAKYRKVLIKMIKDRMHMLDLINLRLAESIEDTHICELVCKFNRLCHANRMRSRFGCEFVISRTYAVNVVLECLRDGVGNGIWPKDVTYDLITSVDDSGVERYYWRIIREKERLIKIPYEEIEIVRRLIETNMQ